MRRIYLVSEPNYQIRNFLTVNLIAIEMKKARILMNKSVYLGLLILELGKTVMYEFWYGYKKAKHGENSKPCYMDTASFIVHVKADDIWKKYCTKCWKKHIAIWKTLMIKKRKAQKSVS